MLPVDVSPLRSGRLDLRSLVSVWRICLQRLQQTLQYAADTENRYQLSTSYAGVPAFDSNVSAVCMDLLARLVCFLLCDKRK